MIRPTAALTIAPLLSLLSACGGGTPCPGPRTEWIAAAATAAAPTAIDTITIDAHDRILWNGAIISEERLRNTLSLADADGHTVRLDPQPGATCATTGRLRIAMERALACGTGRCLENPSSPS